jgi:hypothetical protein
MMIYFSPKTQHPAPRTFLRNFVIVMKLRNYILPLICTCIVLLSSCKKNNNDFYEYSTPSFSVWQVEASPESFYAKCTSHEVYMDSIIVTSPLGIRSQYYYQGHYYDIDATFLVGDTFIPHDGKWQFIIYGRKSINKLSFRVFAEKEI